MKQYVTANRYKNQIYVREIVNGVEYCRKVRFQPYIFQRSSKPTEYKDFYGNQYVKTYQLKHLGSVAKNVGVAGTIVSSATNIGIGFVEDGNQIGENTQRAAVKSVGSWAGATLGAKYCAGFCTPICPPWGTIVGGFVGGVAGGLGGEWLFENGYDLIP